MNKVDKIFDILKDKGTDIRQVDLDEVELLITEIDPEEWLEKGEFFYEGLALIVNDPLYEGDVEPVS